ncbi:hypothetical protein N0V83_007816 [Neocucurbitaria cava]|uniref:PAS-like domain-containing protein n=1 Tax=Neocucurbitaria cava TaxID=798079 RepID=A0A9W9CJV2_9PLEO|nr:hypothetical protein N0V83_007816 [Neocucurbitaria cava]
MPEPPASIFTGIAASPLDEGSNPEYRRLSTPEYHESLITSPDGPKPPTPTDRRSISSCPQPTTWIPDLPLDPSDSTRRPRGTQAVKTPPAVAGSKRSAPPTVDYTPTPLTRPTEPASEPLHKRRRLQIRSRQSLPPFALTKGAPLHHDGRPPSPLFFSSRSARPPLPARFSSSEAAARMLSKTRDEGGIKTVTLARGTFSGLSPPPPTSVASGRSSERSSLPRTLSPEARERSDPLRLLGSVGIVELLEQDGRPTFIADIGDAANYAPEATGLPILFANNALRCSSSIWELVNGKQSGTVQDEATAHAASQFRGWLLSTEGESIGANPSPVEHGGIVWSCYTLRKRLRVVCGAEPSPTTISLPSTSTANRFSLPLTSPAGPASRTSKATASSYEPIGEQQDYFGDAMPTIVHGEPQPPVPVPQNHVDHTSVYISDNGNKPFHKSSIVGISSVEDSPSYTNECVLRAHSAGDVDSFYREPNGPQDESHDMGFFDWTRLSLSPSLPRHIQFARSIDWASTPLGPIEHWSNDLRAMCNLIM